MFEKLIAQISIIIEENKQFSKKTGFSFTIQENDSLNTLIEKLTEIDNILINIEKLSPNRKGHNVKINEIIIKSKEIIDTLKKNETLEKSDSLLPILETINYNLEKIEICTIPIEDKTEFFKEKFKNDFRFAVHIFNSPLQHLLSIEEKLSILEAIEPLASSKGFEQYGHKDILEEFVKDNFINYSKQTNSKNDNTKKEKILILQRLIKLLGSKNFNFEKSFAHISNFRSNQSNQKTETELLQKSDNLNLRKTFTNMSDFFKNTQTPPSLNSKTAALVIDLISSGDFNYSQEQLKLINENFLYNDSFFDEIKESLTMEKISENTNLQLVILTTPLHFFLDLGGKTIFLSSLAKNADSVEKISFYKFIDWGNINFFWTENPIILKENPELKIFTSLTENNSSSCFTFPFYSLGHKERIKIAKNYILLDISPNETISGKLLSEKYEEKLTVVLSDKLVDPKKCDALKQAFDFFSEKIKKNEEKNNSVTEELAGPSSQFRN